MLLSGHSKVSIEIIMMTSINPRSCMVILKSIQISAGLVPEFCHAHFPPPFLSVARVSDNLYYPSSTASNFGGYLELKC